jgi:large exoprotein involved in heme utilization and adhesion
MPQVQDIRVTDNAKVQVNNQGVGNGGTLRVNANYIFLENGGRITAVTASGTGGNIELQARNLLLMRGNSEISATAFSIGDGGNINITTPLLVSFPTEDSDITANSRDRRGGNVTINSSAIFGTQFRKGNTSLSDITATGANAQNGTVQINTPDVDPTSGLIELPVNIVDSTRLIAQGCPANRGNSFTITGRGGLPPSPSEPMRANNTVLPNWVTGDRSSQRISTQNSSIPNQIVEATGWIVNDKGQVELIASAPTPTPNSNWFAPISCPNNVLLSFL